MKNSTKIVVAAISGIFIVILLLSVSARMMTQLNGADKSNSDKNIVGNGNIKTESITVNQYDKANINGEFDVIIQLGKNHTATLTTDENIFPYIIKTSADNQLMIGLQQGISVTPSMPQKLVVTTQELHDIHLNGKNALHAENFSSDHLTLTMQGNNQGDLQGDIKKLQVSLSGKSNLHVNLEHSDNIDLTTHGDGIIYLSGNVKHLNITVAGKAAIDAKYLLADSIIIQGAGETEMILHAVNKLSILIAGRNNIKYYGNPVLNTHYFGQTHVERVNSNNPT